MKSINKIWISSFIVMLLMIGRIAFAQDTLDAEGVVRIFDNLAEFIIVVGIAVGVIYIVWNGIKIATAGGNVTKLQDAKKSLGWGVVGVLVILGVYVIINTIQNLVTGKF